MFNGSEYGAVCQQNTLGPPTRPLSDDCLFLKLLILADRQPTTRGQVPTNLMPIYVSFPGGGFTVVDNSYEMLKQSDVVVSRGVSTRKTNL